MKFLLFLLFSVILSSCSSNTNSSASNSNEEKIVSSECIEVSREKMNTIASGEQTGVGMIPNKAFAVKSPDFNNVYFVALDFSAPGIDNVIGVWATNNLGNEGIILAADFVAQEFTVWPWGSVTDAKISPSDPFIEKAKECFR